MPCLGVHAKAFVIFDLRIMYNLVLTTKTSAPVLSIQDQSGIAASDLLAG